MGDHSVVVGLTAPARTVTFRAGEDCTLQAGDDWSVTSNYFTAAGTFDGTPASLTDAVTVAVPGSDAEVGSHPVTVTLEDSTNDENDVVEQNQVRLIRRSYWRGFNVFPESPAPQCGSTTGTVMHGRGQYLYASWTRQAYRPYAGRNVRLLSNVAPGVDHEPDNLEENTRDTAVTSSTGWASFTFRPPNDAHYAAHYGGTSGVAHADSGLDYVNCTP